MKKILVIEDNLEVRENITEILQLSSYEVITAEDGKVGVELALQQPPDLILCDIMMPGLDGYGVLHLLNKHIETYGIPFIFLTAKSEKGDLRRGMEMGADDYITKPFDVVELLSAIEVRLKKAESIKQSVIKSNNDITTFINNAKQTGHIQLTSEERELYDYKKKDMVYAEGQRPKAVYYIKNGKIKIYKSNEDGKELITAICSTGDFFGYTYILEEISYKENAKVLEDAELMLIPKDDFLSLISSDAQVARQFIKLITRNVLDKEENLLMLAYNSLRKKVAYQLIQVFEKFKNENSSSDAINISRENLAQTAGIATESLIRTLSDFKSEKLIDLQGSTITILNETKLRNLPF
ncbi:response regulator [Parafilimonas sp.]|jgi:DNA-binding response OmpR family regulator|uniref:response regulator n=1 Tax=Parafilimonas sp. TaxID=1969739 RepID=UPI003F7F3567